MPPARSMMSLAAAASALLAAGGCFLSPKLQPPQELASPYGHRQLWAVAPFANESGVSTVDTYRFADLFTQQLQHAVDIDTIPVNRVIFAMRSAGMKAIATPSDAVILARSLGADAVVVGTVTAWDPYPPPTLGVAVELYPASGDRGGDLDVTDLVRATRGRPEPHYVASAEPLALAAGVFDASSHQTLEWLQEYAAGRTEPDSALGSDIHLMSMELYTQFVSYRLIHDLLASERSRLTPLATHGLRR